MLIFSFLNSLDADGNALKMFTFKHTHLYLT